MYIAQACENIFKYMYTYIYTFDCISLLSIISIDQRGQFYIIFALYFAGLLPLFAITALISLIKIFT